MGRKISTLISFLFYYFIVLPISLLPLWVIYLFTDFIYFIFRYIYPYRKDVIRKNIKYSFPEKSHENRRKIHLGFYRHLTDLLAESIKNISISKTELKTRIKVKNPEVMNDLFQQGKNVLLVSGHYNNWEFMITVQNLILKHKAVGIGMPLSNAFWQKKLNQRRARFGMKIITSHEVPDFFSKIHPKPIATLILSDQSPGDFRKSYWMTFLNQATAVTFGCEYLAHKYNHSVVFFNIKKEKRGHYVIEFTPVCITPSSMEWGEITEIHTKKLELAIQSNPNYWLWSHNRWKRRIPEDIEVLKQAQKEKFDATFKVTTN